MDNISWEKGAWEGGQNEGQLIQVLCKAFMSLEYENAGSIKGHISRRKVSFTIRYTYIFSMAALHFFNQK